MKDTIIEIVKIRLWSTSASDSLDLKEKIEMALDPQIIIEDIAKGNF
jgi:hypothetical protein